MDMTRIRAIALRAALVVALVLSGCGGTNAHGSNPRSVAIVSGTVTAGPTCPVERAGHPCPPRPVIATIRAILATRVAASTRSAVDGTYRFELSTGTYTITATSASAFPRCLPKQINVIAPAPAEINISCDTGIR